jgi:hypothetical protein
MYFDQLAASPGDPEVLAAIEDRLGFLQHAMFGLGAYLTEHVLRVRHAPRVEVADKRKARRIEIGDDRGEVLAAEADIWRVPILEFCRTTRKAHPSWGQKRLAGAAIEHGETTGLDLPDFDSVVTQIRNWEVAGQLLRSTSHPETKGGGKVAKKA